MKITLRSLATLFCVIGSAISGREALAQGDKSNIIFEDDFSVPYPQSHNRWYYYTLTDKPLGPTIIVEKPHCWTREGAAVFFYQQPWEQPWPGYVESKGDWWVDPNHKQCLNIIAFVEAITAANQTLDLTDSHVRFKMQIPSLKLVPDAHLYFWFQTAGEMVDGKMKNADYIFSKVKIDKKISVGNDWKEITLKLTSKDADWECIASAPVPPKTSCNRPDSSGEYYYSPTIADKLKRVKWLGFIIFPVPEDGAGTNSNHGRILLHHISVYHPTKNGN